MTASKSACAALLLTDAIALPLLIGIAPVAPLVAIVGALLVMALLITPAAAAARVVSGPLAATVLSVVFAEISAVGGILLALAPGVPVSAFITTIAFVIYMICRVIGTARNRRGSGRVAATA